MKFNATRIMKDISSGRSIRTSLFRGLASSGLSGIWRTLAVGLLDSMTVADVTITNQETGEKISLAWIPEKISVKEAAQFQSYNIIERGEVKLPKGRRLAAVSWESIFPGENRKEGGFFPADNWREPTEVIRQLQKWRDKGSKLNLLVTQTSVNLDVYIDRFDYSFAGGQGDAKYRIDFLAAEDLVVMTVQEADQEKEARQASERTAKQEGRPPLKKSGIPILHSRASPAKPASVTGRQGENAWHVAERELGSGARWNEVAAMNANKIKDAENVPAGVRLKLPS